MTAEDGPSAARRNIVTASVVRVGRFVRARPAVAVAVAVGIVLRVAWVIWVAQDPPSSNSDPGRMLAMARQFSTGETYRLNGIVSAFHPSGYPILLTPLAWLSRVTGLFSLPLAAGLANAAFGTATVLSGAWLADRVAGRRAATVGAWILALAPGHIYLTSVALTETAFTAFALAFLVVTVDLRDRDAVSWRSLAGLGLLAGFATLIRGQGLVLLPVAWWALRSSMPVPRPRLGAAAGLALGTVVMLAPWTLRNGIQVGVWTPSATSNAAYLCHARGPDAVASNDEITEANFRRCFTGTPYTPDVADEAAWYGRTVDDAVRWTLDNPRREIELDIEKTVAVFDGDSQSLADARDFDTRRIASDDVTNALDTAANDWHWAVLALGLGSLLLVADMRRASVLWLTATGMVMSVWAGVAADRYHHTVMALAAVGAAALVAHAVPAGTGGRVWSSTSRRVDAVRASSGPGPQIPVAAALTGGEAIWAALVRSVGHAALGLAVATLAFDVVSWISSAEFVYARGAWLLTALTATTALLATAASVRQWVTGSGSRRDLVLAAMAFIGAITSMLFRQTSGFAVHDPAPLFASGLTLAGTLTLLLLVNPGAESGA